MHEYLKKINAEDPVLEYCLFQPGTFMNYLSYPHRSAAHLAAQCIGTDIGEKHALMTEDGEAYQVFTTVQDLAKVVARAIGFEGKWPKTGGVVGSRIQQRKIVELAEKHAGERTTSVAETLASSIAPQHWTADKLECRNFRSTPSAKDCRPRK